MDMTFQQSQLWGINQRGKMPIIVISNTAYLSIFNHFESTTGSRLKLFDPSQNSSFILMSWWNEPLWADDTTPFLSCSDPLFYVEKVISLFYACPTHMERNKELNILHFNMILNVLNLSSNISVKISFSSNQG